MTRGLRTKGRRRILAVSGPSGVGKTRLLVRLIPALIRRGVTVAALKHTGHPHELDRRGKDSQRLRSAGATAVAIQGPAEMAYFGPPVADVRALARLLPPVDLVLAEGFKSERLDRLEVHRHVVSPQFLCAKDARVLAVVSDEAPPRKIAIFDSNQVEALAEFLCQRLELGLRPPSVRRGQRRDGHAKAGQRERRRRINEIDRR